MAQTRAQKALAAAKRAKEAALLAAATPAGAAAPAEVTAPVIDKSKKTAGENRSVVFVVSKITRGLYLDIFQPVEMTRKIGAGMTDKFTQQMRLPERVRIKPAVLAPGLLANYPIVDGFSITRDVPADHWRKWVEQNPQYEPYTDGLIRAFDTEAEAISYAKEFAALRTGLEPLKQEKDERVPTGANQHVGDVDIDDGK